MDLDELKNKWQTMSVRVDRIEGDISSLADSLASGRVNTVQRKLRNFHRLSAVAGLAVVLLAPALKSIGFPMWICVIYAFYGFVMGIANYAFSSYIAETDYASKPVVKALEQAVKICRWQRNLKIAGLAGGFAVIAAMLYVALGINDNSLFYGLVAGLVAGIAVGLKKEREGRRLARQLCDELRSCMHPEK